MPLPTRPLVDDSIHLLSTEENYILRADPANVAGVLEALAKDLRSGRIALQFSSQGGRLKREHHKRKDKPVEIHVDLGAYFKVPLDYVLHADMQPAEGDSAFPGVTPYMGGGGTLCPTLPEP